MPSTQLAQTEVPIDFENFSDSNVGGIPGTLQGAVESDNFVVSFGDWTGNIFSIIMTFSLLILLGMLVYGAVQWLTSQGDSSKLEGARNRMVHAVIGILILSSVLAIFLFVQWLLGLDTVDVGGAAGGATTG